MENEAFEMLVRDAVLTLPIEFRQILENVEITIEDMPSSFQSRKLHLKNNQILFGLYEGVPKTKRGSSYGMVLPDKITIFKNPITSYGWSDAEMREHVRDVVLHEIGHHFGLSDREIRRAGK
ncbi:MAG: hypothetical protein RLZZ455_883 [Candidatus Parcubacteria bacterium]|jgi:predicted Zn-dependent protease with MMP-like domain